MKRHTRGRGPHQPGVVLFTYDAWNCYSHLNNVFRQTILRTKNSDKKASSPWRQCWKWNTVFLSGDMVSIIHCYATFNYIFCCPVTEFSELIRALSHSIRNLCLRNMDWPNRDYTGQKSCSFLITFPSWGLNN